jgi:hypothetical protein
METWLATRWSTVNDLERATRTCFCILKTGYIDVSENFEFFDIVLWISAFLQRQWQTNECVCVCGTSAGLYWPGRPKYLEKRLYKFLSVHRKYQINWHVNEPGPAQRHFHDYSPEACLGPKILFDRVYFLQYKGQTSTSMLVVSVA